MAVLIREKLSTECFEFLLLLFTLCFVRGFVSYCSAGFSLSSLKILPRSYMAL